MAILRPHRSVRWFWLFGVLAAAFCALFVASAAGNLPGSTCDMADGNLVLNDEACDWVNAPNRAVAIDLPTGQTDNSFGQGTKEDSPVPTIVTGSIPNNKSDLTRFYVAHERLANRDELLYLAWERVQEPSGTTNMDFEFNQSSTLSSNGVTPVRTAGDVLINYDLDQGGTVPTLGLRRWVTTGNPATLCEANNTVPCWGKVQSLAGNFEGSINTVPVTDPVPPNAPRTLSARTFGEAAINLSAAGILPPGCVSFSGAYLKSRSSTSFSAELKDFIAPVPVEIRTCASKSGIKFHDLNANGTRDSGEPVLPGWTMKIYRDANHNRVLEDADDGTTGNGAVPYRPAAITDANGRYLFDQLPADDYIVCEVVQSGWSESRPNSGSPERGDCTSQSGDATLAPVGYAFTLGDVNLTGNDFGNFRNATKSGVKFDDLNGDGDRDTGEPGVAGVQIHLFGTDGAGSAVHVHATTGANGGYSFSVAPGVYTVCETIPTGYTQSFPTAGADCSLHGGGLGYAITLRSGEVDSDNDFGNFRNATKSGVKFDDLNGNGARNAGEPGIAGVQIHLFGTDGRGNAVHVHATTGATGGYSFSVAPGVYTVCETIPTGYTQSFPTAGADCSSHGGGLGYAITLRSGEVDSDNDFGNFRNATKSGVKFDDLNGNGARNAGEPGIAGVQIHLFGTDGRGNAVHVHATTGATGGYSFSVAPGVYTVCETIPTGYTQSFPTAGADCSSHGGGLGYAITLRSGDVDSDNDFGNFLNATKSGTKFDDLNGDGDRDSGEPGIASVQIHLFGTDGRGNPVHVHATTGATGGYSFSVAPGVYTVCETIPTGYTQSMPGSGPDCSGHADAGGRGYAITLRSGEVDSDNDFGNFRNATKSGVKFDDLNGDGDRDTGEPGLPGVQIHLFGTDGRGNSVHLHATSGATGGYSFSVAPGVYTVCETIPTGYTQSMPSTGPDCSSHPDAGGKGYAITLRSGDVDSDNDFGNFRNATKSGTKFDDLNGNGARNPGEPGIAGVQIHLFGTDGRGNAVHVHATTGATGGYSFLVAPGVYTVCETIPTGYTQSFPTAGADCSSHGGGLGYAITLRSGDVDPDNDFGNFRNATKSGTKFDDLNGNGAREIAEPGVAGVQIHLFGTDGRGNAVHLHAITALDGTYSISVAPGLYTVCETIPTGYTQSFPTAGADCSLHGGGLGYSITLRSGDVDSDNDFGNFLNATKSGTKFDDLNGDGDRDSGEPGIASVQIHLFGTDGRGNPVHVHATTGATGGYSFSVAPGVYTVCETIPTGYTQSFPTAGADCSSHGGGLGYSITLRSGDVDSGNDFGNFRNGTVIGVKFKDSNADGDRDVGEPGLGGWIIHVFGTDGRGNAVHMHVATVANGTYSFSVAPGTYTLCETVSDHAGWEESYPTSGADCTGHTHGGTITPGDVGHSVTATSGGTAGDEDFGNTPLSRVRVNFDALADLPGGGDATRATSISCVDAAGHSVGSVVDLNSLTSDDVKTSQSSITCTITFTDP